jgi:uncharacterized protein YjbI with pentapeptide repeats
MANKNHLKILEQGVTAWNLWREDNPAIRPNLAKADLQGMHLQWINLTGANLRQANLCNANLADANLMDANLKQTVSIEDKPAKNRFASALGSGDPPSPPNQDYPGNHHAFSFSFDSGDDDGGWSDRRDHDRAWSAEPNNEQAESDPYVSSPDDVPHATLSRANMSGADLGESDLRHADMHAAILINASLYGATLYGVNLSGAYLKGVKMRYARLIDTNLAGARIENCSIYGISTWNLNLTDTIQSDLIITPRGEPSLTVDDLETAQFIYTLLTNEKLRKTIDTIASKVVLILGRFTPEQKDILDGIRGALRSKNYIPVLFDFQKPVHRDITETVSTLAHMARFIIADITDAKSIPQELQRIIPDLPSVPVQPILLASDEEYGMFEHFKRYAWVLKTQIYGSKKELLDSFDDRVIAPVEKFLQGLT